MEAGVAGAFKIGVHFVADVAGLAGGDTAQAQGFLKNSGIGFGRTNHGGCQHKLEVTRQAGVLQNLRQARIPVGNDTQNNTAVF